MKPQTLKGLEARLMHFLEELLEPMGRRERQHWARVYVQGLLLDGERKSIEPMASRIAGADVQALRQFVGQSPWAVEEVQRRLAHKVVDLLSDAEVWIIDETSFPKAGQHSVGVARQYCGTLGKIANCQVAVSLHWASAEASCPLAQLPQFGREKNFLVGGGQIVARLFAGASAETACSADFWYLRRGAPAAVMSSERSSGGGKGGCIYGTRFGARTASSTAIGAWSARCGARAR